MISEVFQALQKSRKTMNEKTYTEKQLEFINGTFR